MICFVNKGVNIYVSKHKFNSFEEKMYDILRISLIFMKIFHDFGWFFATRIRNTGYK